jgi:formiminotetrahydrofolate cyclodeaminase
MMGKRIKDQKIERFLQELASKSPTPGGGSAAALAGATSYSLISMVSYLTIGKEKYRKVESRIKRIAEEAEGAAKKLLVLADNDAGAFDMVMAAYKSKSMSRIKRALERAIEVPQKTRKLCVRAEKLAKIVSRLGNRNAVSDARSAVHLAKAAQKMAEENIKINKQLLASLG